MSASRPQQPQKEASTTTTFQVGPKIQPALLLHIGAPAHFGTRTSGHSITCHGNGYEMASGHATSDPAKEELGEYLGSVLLGITCHGNRSHGRWGWAGVPSAGE